MYRSVGNRHLGALSAGKSARQQNGGLEIYIELKDVDQTNHVVSLLSTEEYKVYKMQITPSRSGLANNIGIEALLRLDKTESKSEALNKISSLPEVAFAA